MSCYFKKEEETCGVNGQVMSLRTLIKHYPQEVTYE